MRSFLAAVSLALFFFFIPALQGAVNVSFSPAPPKVERFDFIQIDVAVTGIAIANPFINAALTGSFTAEGTSPINVEGFCDSPDGSLYRIRFMPSRTGKVTYSLRFKAGIADESTTGSFTVVESKRGGIVHVDPQYPFHFISEGTGQHYFWNGTTAYFLAGWRNPKTLEEIFDRYRRFGVNEVRVALSGRVKDGRAWFENVFPTQDFTFFLCPWRASSPDSLDKPGLDAERFDTGFWRHFEDLLRIARERDVHISVVFYVDGSRPGTDPFGKPGMGGPAEELYYRYTIARFAPFSNVFWDLANEYRLFRNDEWANKMGDLVKRTDPYNHLTSTHGHGDFRFSSAKWPDYAMYQRWDDSGGHDALLRLRHEEARAGRPMPQVNAEYGYEDHYPVGWGDGKTPPARAADNRRRLAWGMYMAGFYQTTGEKATPAGGWINGRADQAMSMPVGYQHIVEFFSRFPWWTTEPHDELANPGAMCLAKPGVTYALYLPQGGGVQLKLESGRYSANAFNARTGQWLPLADAEGPEWRASVSSELGDWAVLLSRQ